MGRIVTVSLALLLIAGSGQAGDGTQGPDALLAADRAFNRAAAEHGLEGWLSYFADDATIFPPGSAIVTGLEAIREHYAATGFTPEGLSWEPVAAEVAGSGDLGFTYGTWTLERRDAEGKTRRETGKYMSVWRLQPDGSWKVIADIGSPDAPQER
jgi:ketosteroid isomerase-like protein